MIERFDNTILTLSGTSSRVARRLLVGPKLSAASLPPLFTGLASLPPLFAGSVTLPPTFAGSASLPPPFAVLASLPPPFAWSDSLPPPFPESPDFFCGYRAQIKINYNIMTPILAFIKTTLIRNVCRIFVQMSQYSLTLKIWIFSGVKRNFLLI